MRRIYKDEILSTYYKDWVDNFDEKHKVYDSRNVHYFDLRMSLFYCQKGLCAYTEERLCKPSLIEKDKWKDGKYIKSKQEVSTRGHIEHFDESLKSEKGWLWDNLFMVDGDINNKKGTKPVNYILKPDSPDYDENKYLQFDYEIDTFFPNINLSKEKYDEVKKMIEVLGINDVQRREDMVQELKDNLDMGIVPREPSEYITAWRMTLSLCMKNNND